MQIKILSKEKGLMIVPETEFERDYLKKFQNVKLVSFIKTGVDLTDVLGLKIHIDDKAKDDPNNF